MRHASPSDRYAALPAGVRAIYPWPGDDVALSDGSRLHYLTAGPSDGPPMLFVHGNPTWSFYWRELVRAFEGTHRCIAPDHLGSGLSDRPTTGTIRLQDHIDHLIALIDHLDLRDVTLVVHDWGGPIGLGAGIARHDRIARVVIFNTSVFLERVPLAIRLCRLPGFGEVVVQGLNAGVRGAILRSVNRPLARAVSEGYLAPYRTWADRRAHMQFFRDIPVDAGHPTRDTLAQIEAAISDAFAHTPVQFIWGDQDFVFTPRFLSRWQELLPHGDVHRIADAAHWVVEDAHERIIPVMRDFLGRTAA